MQDCCNGSVWLYYRFRSTYLRESPRRADVRAVVSSVWRSQDAAHVSERTDCRNDRASERRGDGAGAFSCDISPHSFHECKCTPIYLKKERNEAQKLSTNFPPFRCRRSACEALPPRMVGTRKKLPLRAAFFRHATPSILTFFMAFLVSGRADCEFPPPFAAARLCLTAVAVRVLFIKQTK